METVALSLVLALRILDNGSILRLEALFEISNLGQGS
jgi:hypothetical protein